MPDEHRTLAALGTVCGGFAALSLAAVLLDRATESASIGAIKFVVTEQLEADLAAAGKPRPLPDQYDDSPFGKYQYRTALETWLKAARRLDKQKKLAAAGAVTAAVYANHDHAVERDWPEMAGRLSDAGQRELEESILKAGLQAVQEGALQKYAKERAEIEAAREAARELADKEQALARVRNLTAAHAVAFEAASADHSKSRVAADLFKNLQQARRTVAAPTLNATQREFANCSRPEAPNVELRRRELHDAVQGYDWPIVHKSDVDYLGPLTLEYNGKFTQLRVGHVSLKKLGGATGQELFEAVKTERAKLDAGARAVWAVMKLHLPANTLLTWPDVRAALADLPFKTYEAEVIYALALLRVGELEPGWYMSSAPPALSDQASAVTLPRMDRVGNSDRVYKIMLNAPSR